MTGIYGINYSNNYSLTGNYGYAYSTGAVSSAQPEEKGMVVNPGKSDVEKPGRKSSPAECETCKNRKYQDGSNEMVSFNSASHISPQASSSRVRAHEQEHVTNAYNKAAQNNGKVLSATVSLRTAVCPECGTVYTAGGTRMPPTPASPTRKPTSRHTSKTTIITTPGCAKVDAARWPHLLCLILLFGPAGKIRRECCADASPAFPEAQNALHPCIIKRQ